MFENDVVSAENLELWKRNPGLRSKLKDAQHNASQDFFHWRKNLDTIAQAMYQKVCTCDL